ncbi:MAG: hypothetical protein RSB48_03185 [Akkermansia sp.]
MNKTLLYALEASCMALMSSCSNEAPHSIWVPVTSGPPRPPVNVQDVLVMNDYPVGDYMMIGHFEAAPGTSGQLSADDSTYSFLKKEAATMGGNTIVVKENPLKFKSGKGEGNRVDVLYVREEMGTHGGDDWGGDTVPMNDELLRIY